MTKLKKIELFYYTNTFSTIGKKESIIIKFTNKDENISYCEVSPLPQRSQETMQKAKQDLFTLCKNLLSNQALAFALSPSVMFAMTTGLLQLQQYPNSLSYTKRDLLITNATKPNLLGFSGLLKVKIKGHTIHEAIDLCKYIRDQGKTFCVDCNQAFSLKEMLYFTKQFKQNEIQYLEEPIFPFTDLVTFTNESSTPIAIDESLYTQPIERLKTLKNLKLFILKPTLIGGYQELQAIINKCGSTPCTLSSSYESPVGISNIITLAHHLKIQEPLGIDTCRYAQTSLLKNREALYENQFISQKFILNEQLLCPLLPE